MWGDVCLLTNEEAVVDGEESRGKSFGGHMKSEDFGGSYYRCNMKTTLLQYANNIIDVLRD